MFGVRATSCARTVRNPAGPAVAVRSWARHDLRARWRGLVVLAVIAGLAGGFAIALFDGSRRTGTAFDRLRSETNGADAAVFTSQVNETHPGAKWTEFARQPEVERLARWYLAFGSINGNNDPDNVLFGSVDGTWLGSVDRRKVIAGRMFHPHSDAEAVISAPVVKSDHVHLGDTITYRSYSEAQSEEQNPGPPQGAELRFRVVGIVRTVQQFLFTPMVMLPQGVVEKHPHDVAWIENGWVRLRSPGPAAIEQLQQDANRILAKGTPILPLRVAQRRIDTTTDVEKTALLLIAIAVAAAGFVL